MSARNRLTQALTTKLTGEHMSPTYRSLAAILVLGVLLTMIMVLSQPDKNSLSQSTQNSAKLSAQQLTDQLSDNLTALSNGLTKLSNSSFWQNANVTDWGQRISTQREIYKAAGLSILGVHAKSSNTFYLDSNNSEQQSYGLESALAKMYRTKRAIKSIQAYKSKPAILLLVPIKTVENEIIGSLIGVKLIDKAMMKHFHYLSKFPAVLVKKRTPIETSLDSIPDLDKYLLVSVSWPPEINTSDWQTVLLVKQQSFFSGGFTLLVIGGLLTLGCLFFVWQQIKQIQNTLRQLNQALNLDLPIAEQIKRLTNIQNESGDLDLLDCSQSIRGRFEQLSQQKKALSIELRKLQEAKNKLEQAKSNLEQERDVAVAAPRLKSEFLSRMGDEITTPMKSVVSMLKLLSEYPFDAEPKQLLNIAKRSTRTLVNNLNNILDFSKLDAEMLRLKNKEFSVRELVDDLSSELSHFANEKNLSLQASSDPEMPALLTADEYRIKQVLRNLLGNAIRFTKDGEVTLYADLTAKGGNKLLRFTIADTGIGISEAAQKGLFDSLQQTTKLSNSSFAGRLRLIVSKKLAELMGGEIGVISEMGQGSQFWFTVTYKE